MVARRREWIALAAVLALGVFLRVYRLDLIPAGLNHDVAWNGLYALRILRGEPYTPYTAEAWGRETTMFYLQALGIRLLGPELPALILPAVAVGILTLPAFYVWQRETFGARVALVATFLLAVSGWHIVFSRIGWRAVLQPLVSIVAYACFARGLRTRGVLAFAAAGAATAAAAYTYNAARLLPLLFPLYALASLALARDRRTLYTTYQRGALAMAGAFAVVVAPMAHYAATHWWAWQRRASATYFLDGHTVWDNLTALAKVYLLDANGDDFFTSTPVLEWPAAVLFVVGTLWALSRWREPRVRFLLLGWLVAAIPAFLSTPNANRMIGTLPFVFAFAGLGFAFLPRSLDAAFGRGSQVSDSESRSGSDSVRRPGTWDVGPGTVLFAFVALGSVGATWVQYFGPHRRELPGFYPETTVLGRYARTLLPDYDVWIGGRNFPRETLDYLTYRGGPPHERAYEWVDDIAKLAPADLAPTGAKGTALILAKEGQSGLVFEQMRRRWPAAPVVPLEDWSRNGAVFAHALLIPPARVDPSETGDEQSAQDQRPATSDERPLLSDARRGSGPGQFLDPRGVAVAADCTVFVADTGNHRVQVFGADGRLRAAFGGRGDAPGSFNEPSALAVDDQGSLHVVDTWNDRIQKLDATGHPLAVYAPPDGFYGPRGIAIAGSKVYVSDTGHHRIETFDVDGKYTGAMGSGEGGDAGQLRNPQGLAVTSNGRLWVVDAGNHRLQVFAPSGAVAKVIPVPGWSGSELREGYLMADGVAVLLTDPLAGKVWRVDIEGNFEERARRLRFPAGLAAAAGGFYVAERDAGQVKLLPWREGEAPAEPPGLL